jgi:hypothetical protein
MRDDAWIEQRRRLKRILVEEVCACELALLLGEHVMRIERVFHLVGARLEYLQQVAVAALKILEHVGQLTGNGLRIKRKNPVNDVIGAGLISGIEVPRLGRRLKRPHDDPCRVRA